MKSIKLQALIILGLFALLVISAGCASPSPSPSMTMPPMTTSLVSTVSAANQVTISLVASNMVFDQSTLTVLAGAQVTMIFDNKDGAPHNFALYTDSSAATVIFKGDVVSAKTITYQFTAPSTAGSYFFRCDVHPRTMTGTFVVQ